MSMIRTNRACGGRFSLHWRGGLAAFVLLAFVLAAPGQVSVHTIGGGGGEVGSNVKQHVIHGTPTWDENRSNGPSAATVS